MERPRHCVTEKPRIKKLHGAWVCEQSYWDESMPMVWRGPFGETPKQAYTECMRGFRFYRHLFPKSRQ